MIPRVIPTLLLADEQFVKTVRFKQPQYVGDPVNVINLFNRFEVDEITLLDIRATVSGETPPYDLLAELAAECWVPLAYGGGLRSVEEIRRTLAVGIEKVVLGTTAAEAPQVVTEASQMFGSQAVVVAVDAVIRRSGGWDVVVASGTRRVADDAIEYARRAEALGAGELLLTSVDRDGAMSGYDLPLIEAVARAVSIPVVACGGAGDRSQLADPIRVGAAAVGAGSIFVFRGPERGVLVNFPTREQLEQVFR